MATTTRTRRTATKGKGATKRRSRYSAAQIEEFKAQDAKLYEMAEEALISPTLGAQVVEAVTAAPHPYSITRYSVRNQGLLLKQADERGEKLGPVATYKQWKAVGRAVKAEEFARPLFICVPAGRDDEDKVTVTTETGDKVQTLADAVEEAPVKFRSRKVYSLAQTEGVEDFDGETPEPEGEPVALLLESLRTQATRAGYALAEGEAPAVDTEARTLTVPAEITPASIAELIGAVAKIAGANGKARAARKARKAAASAADGAEVLNIA